MYWKIFIGTLGLCAVSVSSYVLMPSKPDSIVLPKAPEGTNVKACPSTSTGVNGKPRTRCFIFTMKLSPTEISDQ